VDRYVLLTLPGPPGWDDLLRCEAGAEVIRCGSIEELEVRLQSGRRYSAVVVPQELAGLAGRLFVPVVVLTSDFTADDLLEGLERAGAMRIPRRDSLPSFETVSPLDSCGLLVAVCGPGGTGASTVAMSLAQGVEGSLLADFALRGNQAVLHGLTDARWGLFEFLERPCLPDLPVLPGRAYRLLPGLRRSSHWTLVRPSQFDRALDTFDLHDLILQNVPKLLNVIRQDQGHDVELASNLVQLFNIVQLGQGLNYFVHVGRLNEYVHKGK